MYQEAYSRPSPKRCKDPLPHPYSQSHRSRCNPGKTAQRGATLQQVPDVNQSFPTQIKPSRSVLNLAADKPTTPPSAPKSLRFFIPADSHPIDTPLLPLADHSNLSKHTERQQKSKKKLAFLRCSDSFIPSVRHDHTFAHHASRNNSSPFGNLLASRYYCRFSSCCSSSITRSGGRGTTELRNTYGSATKGIPAATTSEVGRRYRGHGD